MNIEQLQLKWTELSHNTISHGYKSLRISADCLPDIYIGINKDANRCLILALPQDYKFDFNGVVKENLTIEFFKEKKYIILQLTDNEFFDLFDDLIISLYQRIKDISSVVESTKEFIQTFYKWSNFFEDKKSDLLPEIVIKGLIGELLVLKTYIHESNQSCINEVLNSWRGPYDNVHDFVLDKKNIEVKTKDFLKLDIRISSEFQLEKELDKGLDLVVVSVEGVLIDGFSIKDIVTEIKHNIFELYGDSSIFLKAISQKGLTMKNLFQYDNYRYRPINQITYDCNSEGFPKLIKSNIPKEINSVNYNLRVSALSEFITSTKDY